jgi:hypothetical protein
VSRSEREREGVRAPAGLWITPLPTRVNESDAERAWSRGRGRVRGDVDVAGWGSFGGGGALACKGARLGTKRGLLGLLRALVWSEGQREGAGFEVLDPVPCPELGRRWGLGLTPVAGRWGRVAYWVRVPAWRVEKRGGDGWRDLCKILSMNARVLSLSPFFQKKIRVKLKLG